jgi:hypothetical protein
MTKTFKLLQQMYFNEELHKDIEKLKSLRAARFTKEFREMRDKVMQKHNISRRTVYYELQKKLPAVTQTNPKGNASEIPPCKVSPDDIIKEFFMPEDVRGKMCPSDDDRNLIYLASMRIFRDEYSSNITGDLVFLFFHRLLNYGLRDTEKGIRMALIDDVFTLTKSDIDDFCLLLANAYNRSAEKQVHIKKDDYLKMKVRHLLEQRLRAGEDLVSFKELDSVTRVYKRLETVTSEININYIQVICNELKPGITIEEVLHLIKKHPESQMPVQNKLTPGA